MEIKEIIEKVNSGIDEVTESFYQGKDSQGYQRLNEMISDLMLLIEKLIEMKGSQDSKDEEKLMETVTDAMNALEQKDTILLSDILKYDLAEQLKSIREKF